MEEMSNKVIYDKIGCFHENLEKENDGNEARQ